MSEWMEISIGKYCKVQGGFAFKSSDFIEKGVPVAKIKNVKERDIDLTDCGFVDENLANSNSDYFVKKGDVLISMTGSGMNAPNSIVGRVARHIGSDNAFLINQRVGRFLIKDETQLDKHFLFHYLSPKERQLELVSIATGSANQVNISGKQIESLKINLPPLPEQKAIAHILGTLDDKIELNRQMNQTLEAMAQALFKSWFVDFDPVMDNALAAGNEIPYELLAMAEKRRVIPNREERSGKQSHSKRLIDTNPELAELFPSSFVFNETLGKWIPEGWEVKKFGDVAKCFDNKRIPLSKKEREEKQPGIYPYYGATSINDYINDYIFDDTYLLLGEDGSVMREDGTPFTQYVWGKIWVNNHAHVLQGKNGVSTEHLLTFIRNEDVGGYVTGAVQLKINQGNMNRIPFLFAKEDLHREFAKILDGIYSKYKLNHEKTETLTQMRNTLLPELISGKVRVNN